MVRTHPGKDVAAANSLRMLFTCSAKISFIELQRSPSPRTPLVSCTRTGEHQALFTSSLGNQGSTLRIAAPAYTVTANWTNARTALQVPKAVPAYYMYPEANADVKNAPGRSIMSCPTPQRGKTDQAR